VPLAPNAPTAVELAVLAAANLLATAPRYGAMRLWVFGPAPTPMQLSPDSGDNGTRVANEGLQGLPAWRARPNPTSRG
jgi:hypothetical protein